MINKRMMAIILGAVISISAVSCTNKDDAKGNNKKEMAIEQKEEDTREKAEVPNPNKEYNSIEDLKKAAGFSFEIPTGLEGDKIKSIFMIDNKIVAISYMKGNTEIQYRASENASNISGIYGDFKEKEVEIDGMKVVVKEKEGKAYVVSWAVDGVNYSISADEGVNQEVLTGILQKKFEIPNPAQEFKSIDELKRASKFKFYIPAGMEKDEITYIALIDNDLASISYNSEGNEITYRASEKLSDISGVFGDFNEKEAEIDSMKVGLKEKDGKIYVAMWAKGGVNYSISSSKGLTQEELKSILK